jgi:hypothetical protein
MKIPQNVRTALAKISTHDSASYWNKPAQALQAINNVLATLGLRVGPVSWDDYLPDYRASYSVLDANDQETDTVLVFSWHIMEVSKRYEITCYLS